MLAMVVNDDVGCLIPRGVWSTIASLPQAGTRSYRVTRGLELYEQNGI